MIALEWPIAEEAGKTSSGNPTFWGHEWFVFQ